MRPLIGHRGTKWGDLLIFALRPRQRKKAIIFSQMLLTSFYIYLRIGNSKSVVSSQRFDISHQPPTWVCHLSPPRMASSIPHMRCSCTSYRAPLTRVRIDNLQMFWTLHRLDASSSDKRRMAECEPNTEGSDSTAALAVSSGSLTSQRVFIVKIS